MKFWNILTIEKTPSKFKYNWSFFFEKVALLKFKEFHDDQKMIWTKSYALAAILYSKKYQSKKRRQ